MFKVMTWNVENLFKPGHDAGPPDQATYETKLQGLAAMINAQAPNALALQEIGDPAALDELVQHLQGTWHKQVSNHPDDPHHPIRVAWLARNPITDSEDIFDFPPHLQPVQVDDDPNHNLAHMGRGAVGITVESDAGHAVRLVTTHLKSKLLTFPGGRFQPHDEDERARFATYALHRRAAEAATVRVAVTESLANDGQNRPLVLTGDLNDAVQAATTQMLLGPPGSEIHTSGFDHPDQGDRQRLWNLAPLMPADKNFSRVFHGEKELIDHILVSAALVKPLDAITVEAVVEQPLPSITEDPSARHADPSSDHAPVVATFRDL